MEIACGEYGDVVPKLVVAAQNDSCIKFHSESLSEIKPINCDKSVDAKNLLRDSVCVNNAMSAGYGELLSVNKLEHDVETTEMTDEFASPWKTVNVFSSDTTIASSKPVSIFPVSSGMLDCSGTGSRCNVIHCECNLLILTNASKRLASVVVGESCCI